MKDSMDSSPSGSSIDSSRYELIDDTISPLIRLIDELLEKFVLGPPGPRVHIAPEVADAAVTFLAGAVRDLVGLIERARAGDTAVRSQPLPADRQFWTDVVERLPATEQGIPGLAVGDQIDTCLFSVLLGRAGMHEFNGMDSLTGGQFWINLQEHLRETEQRIPGLSALGQRIDDHAWRESSAAAGQDGDDHARNLQGTPRP